MKRLALAVLVIMAALALGACSYAVIEEAPVQVGSAVLTPTPTAALRTES